MHGSHVGHEFVRMRRIKEHTVQFFTTILLKTSFY